jgi:hypothetical protein
LSIDSTRNIYLKGHQGPQSPGITDTRFFSVVPCEIPFLIENNGLRDLRATYEISGQVTVFA